MTPPIVHRKAGTQPWLDEEETPAMRLPWRLLGGCGFLIILVVAAAGLFLLGLSPDPIRSESVAGVVSVTASESPTATTTPTLTPTATDWPSMEGTTAPPMPPTAREMIEALRAFVMMIIERIRSHGQIQPTSTPTIDLGPTYTLTPEAEGEQGAEKIVYQDRIVDRVVEIVVTSPPRVVYQDRIVEVIVTSPPLYIIVTATPTATLTLTATPTLGPEQTEEPQPTIDPEQTLEAMPTCEPIFCEVLPPPPLAAVPGYRK